MSLYSFGTYFFTLGEVQASFLNLLTTAKGGSVNEDDDYFSAVRCFDVKTFEFSFPAKLVLTCFDDSKRSF